MISTINSLHWQQNIKFHFYFLLHLLGNYPRVCKKPLSTVILDISFMFIFVLQLGHKLKHSKCSMLLCSALNPPLFTPSLILITALQNSTFPQICKWFPTAVYYGVSILPFKLKKYGENSPSGNFTVIKV